MQATLLSTTGKSAYFLSVAYTVVDLEYLKEIRPVDLRLTTSVSGVLPEAGFRNGIQKVYHLYQGMVEQEVPVSNLKRTTKCFIKQRTMALPWATHKTPIHIAIRTVSLELGISCNYPSFLDQILEKVENHLKFRKYVK